MVDLANNFITSSGLVEIGDLWSKSIIDIAVDAGKKALDESTNNPDLIIIANMFSSLSSNQENLGYVITDALGLTGLPTFKIESGECSGAMACHVANNLLKKDTFDSIMVIGVEKMYDLLPPKIIEALSIGETYEFSQYFFLGFETTDLFFDVFFIKRHHNVYIFFMIHRYMVNF